MRSWALTAREGWRWGAQPSSARWLPSLLFTTHGFLIPRMFSATERLHWRPGEHFQLRLQPLPRSPQSSLLLPPRKVIRHVWHEGCSRLVSHYSRLHPCLSPSPRSSLSTHQSPVGPHPPWPCRRLLSVPGCTTPPCLGRPWGDLRRLDSHYTMSLWPSFLRRCSQKMLDETETSPIW